MFDAIRDGRTTEECKGLNGTIMPADDPWWEGRVPPLHYNCRSGIRSLRQSEAEAHPKFTELPPDLKGSKTFGAKPRRGLEELKVDPSRYPGGIGQEIESQIKAGPKSPLPLREPPTAVEGPDHGPDAKRGGQWEPGHVRSDVLIAKDRATPMTVPWHRDEEPRPAGWIRKEPGAKKVQPHEIDAHKFLANQGNNVLQLKEVSKVNGERFADISIDGILVEIATVLGKSPGDVLKRKAKRGQAEYLFMDARPSGMSYLDVMAQIGRGRPLAAQKKFRAIRIVGVDFDVTLFP